MARVIEVAETGPATRPLTGCRVVQGVRTAICRPASVRPVGIGAGLRAARAGPVPQRDPSGFEHGCPTQPRGAASCDGAGTAHLTGLVDPVGRR